MINQIYFSLVIVGLLLVLLGIVRLRRTSVQEFILSLAGAIVGLLLGALASVPLSQLPHPYGAALPIIVSIFLTVSFIALALARQTTLIHALPFLRFNGGGASTTPSVVPAETPVVATPSEILVDTSVIIDGRIADIATAGFVPGRLLVPRFVLAELQNIADSDDAMRRGRGRRGLEVLNRLRETDGIEVEIIEQDAPEIKEVDHKLVALAQTRHCDVLTTDYNLNRVAQIQGVRVLNINELANAIRPVVIPGEELRVRVVQPGKERNQGVGYLADGTMIVVENGDKLMGEEVTTEVTRVFQTVAGKMIFAAPKGPLPVETGKSGRNKRGDKSDKKGAVEVPDVLPPVAELDAPVMPPAPDVLEPKPPKAPRPNRQANNNGRRRRPESIEDRLIRTANEHGTNDKAA